MKIKTKFIVEVEEIIEVPEENKEKVIKAIEDKKPLFDEEQKDDIIQCLAFELDAKKEDIKITSESYEIIED